jgi:GAF domain-containing protein
MRRGAKPAQAKVEGERPATRKSPESDGAKLRDLEKRLAAALKDKAEALEQQTATSEILCVISTSPTDVQPVFDAIAESAVRLCDGLFSSVFTFDGTLIHFVAHNLNWTSEGRDAFRRGYPRIPSRDTQVAQAILERAVVEVRDLMNDPGVSPASLDLARALGYRSNLVVPMLREGSPIGAIGVARIEAGSFSAKQIALLKTFADQAVIAIENVRLFKELQASNRDLTTALDKQTATSDILRVISRSQTEIQPVFDAILASAVRLLRGYVGAATRVVGDHIELAALTSIDDGADAAVKATFPQSLQSELPHPRAIRDRAPINIADALMDPQLPEAVRAYARARGFRSLVTVPMLRHDAAVGAISVTRREAGGFTDDEIALLQTFADQAVIAIENVRLFTELQTSNRDLTTALDKQTATSEILQVISQSQTDVQPVFDAIVNSAVRLLAGYSGTMTRVVGEQVALVAFTSTDDAGNTTLIEAFPWPLDGPGPNLQAVRDRAPVNIANTQTDPRVGDVVHAIARARGYQSLVAVPMLHHDEALGAIAVTRREPGGFTDDEIALLKIFADQAVIAIENVRLFTELEARNRDLTEALERQTATSEILNVISASPTDVHPVFAAICKSAVRLFGAYASALIRFDGQLLQFGAVVSPSAEADERYRLVFPRPPDRELGTGRAILDRAIVHVPDIERDTERNRELGRDFGYRRLLVVPMMRGGEAIGALAVTGREPGRYSDQQIALLQTFANQAVIAIQNEHLFRELQDRTTALSRSVDQLTALSEVGRAVSSTLDLETVLTTIVSRAVELSGLDGGVVFEYDDGTEEFVHRVATEAGGVLAEERRATRVRKGEGVVGRTAVTREPSQVLDITVPGAYESRLRENLIESGVRAILAVPMVREDQLIGCLVVSRNSPGQFPAETIDLLRTFATQSALAIQNARLFRELADKSHQLEVASRHKSEFLANMSHELRTPLNAIIGFSEVLTDRMFGELNEKQEEYLKDIYASGTHLLSLINDILDLSKIEAGRMELELTDFHLPTALDNAMTLVRERATRRGIALQTNVDDRLGEIRADERKIRQVVLNLLSNAIKFTPEGGRIEVGAVPKDGSVEVSVSDTGVGIAPEDQDAIFEEFRQSGPADKKAEGTGLGLTLCRKFIELHGGRIWVKSQVGVGSTFTFTIPVRRGE